MSKREEELEQEVQMLRQMLSQLEDGKIYIDQDSFTLHVNENYDTIETEDVIGFQKPEWDYDEEAGIWRKKKGK